MTWIVELIGGDARVGESHQLGQRGHPAGVQLLEAGGVTQLGRPVDGKGQLGVQRLFRPQGASLSNTAIRSGSGTKSGESRSVTAATNSTIDLFAVVSRQPGS
jgi:hypothetical protein